MRARVCPHTRMAAHSKAGVCMKGERVPSRSCSLPGPPAAARPRTPSLSPERTCPVLALENAGAARAPPAGEARRGERRGAAGRPAGAPHLPPDWPRRRRSAGGRRMMDGLSAGPGPSSGGLASVNTSSLRGSRHWAGRARCLHKRTGLGMFRFWRLVSIISLWEKGKRTMGKWRAKKLASFGTDAWQII